MKYSEHFNESEMTRTKTGLDNSMPGDRVAEIEANITRLCNDVLEPILALLDCPLVGHSCYRNPYVNAACHGDPNSAHMDGRAYDFHPACVGIEYAFDAIKNSSIPFDKLIIETKGRSRWIHVQVRKGALLPRRITKTATVDPETGKAVYKEV